MINISNQNIDANKCTKCICGKSSWYVMLCDCKNIFCENCSAKDEDNYKGDIIMLICPKCGKSTMYV